MLLNLKLKVLIKITIFVIFVALKSSLAGIYIGIGLNASNDRYSVSETNPVDAGFARQFNVFRASAGTIIDFAGSIQELENLIFTTIPHNPIQFDTFVVSDGLGNPNSITLQQCQMGGVPVSSFNCPSPFGPGNGGILVTPTLSNVQQDIGSSFLNFLQTGFGGAISITFETPAAQIEFETLLGQNILNTIMGTANYTIDDLTNAITNGFPNPSIFQPIDITNPNLELFESQVQIQTISLLDPNFLILFLTSQQGIWLTLQDGTAVLIDFDTKIAEKASAISFGVLLGLGYAQMYKNWFYGTELLLDLGNTDIGKNDAREVELGYKFTANLIGRAGYNFFDNAVNYLNLGFAIRRYHVSGFGTDFSTFKPHFVFGAGMELFLTNKMNLFGEYNHIFTLAKVQTKLGDGTKLNVKSDKISLGVRYYFDSNPLIQTSAKKVSSERMEKYNKRICNFEDDVSNCVSSSEDSENDKYDELSENKRFKRINKVRY